MLQNSRPYRQVPVNQATKSLLMNWYVFDKYDTDPSSNPYRKLSPTHPSLIPACLDHFSVETCLTPGSSSSIKNSKGIMWMRIRI